MSARILVVDDVPANVKLLEARLSAEYFDVLTASNGTEALAICARAECDIILLDVMMPDIDGWTVLAALKGDPALADIPVVIVTIVDEQRRGIALGAAGYMTKPIDRERLVEILSRYRGAKEPSTVLIIEDDEAQRRLVGEVLGAQGWVVREAANGRLALDDLKNGALPNIILLDLMMPEMDGFEVVAALQANSAWRDIPVVVLTALDLTAQDRRLKGGVERILSKSAYAPAELMKRVGILLCEVEGKANSGRRWAKERSCAG